MIVVKKILILAIACLMVFSLPAQKTIIHDPNVELRPVKGFHAIDVSDAINVYLSPGDQETVAVSASDTKWRDRIRTEIRDGVLKIWLDGHGRHWQGGNKKLKAYISFTTLDRLSASGASDIYVDGVISGNSLSIGLSGASDFKGAVHMNDLSVDQSGASDAVITGSVANSTKIQVSGASDLKGYDLTTDQCDAEASGASDIRITVNKELNAHARGASSIYYKGAGIIKEKHSSGASNVSKKN
jgi:Putative auto-transporter adhesin, head GIN domain